MIKVVEVRRNAHRATGDIIRSAEFQSWQSAWKYYEKDLLHSRKCVYLNVYRLGKGHGIIQHWGETTDEATHICPELTVELKEWRDKSRRLD